MMWLCHVRPVRTMCPMPEAGTKAQGVLSCDGLLAGLLMQGPYESSCMASPPFFPAAAAALDPLGAFTGRGALSCKR